NRASRRLAVAFGVGATVAIVTGTVVTGSGPHAGDEDAIRLGFDIPDVVRIHSISVWLTMVSLIALAVVVRRTGRHQLYGPVSMAIGVLVAQGFVGYVQYFADIPAALVALHIAGSIAVTIVSTNLVSASLGFGGRAQT
ncbi:MAG: heme A synthase, partial [Actinomycetota bacterium]